ncbi:zinc finger protein 236 isoform X2 [Anopheles merus]|uniref:zinc finger protein 236 isoform X2 n=1 Tax=Anopheles merus TaxID=30066 RepID=UPI001BE40580|nr:zinc finger protein 236 isoform X2 [Anopheles merus]
MEYVAQKSPLGAMEQLTTRNIELDKICRICLVVKKEMRPLFGEMIAEMLMEIAKIQIEQMDGWPDKICVQCIHQVSRCHAFKTRVEKSDVTLRQYIKGITVTEDQDHKECIQKEIQNITLSPPKLQQMAPAMIAPQLHELHIQRTDMQAIQTEAPLAAPAMILTSAQLINAGAQIINTGHIITTATGQQIIQTTPQFQAASIGQFIQGPNNTVQMITQNGHPAHVLQIQRTADDRCEIIVQPEMTEAQYLENVSSVPLMVTAPAATTAIPTDAIHTHQLHHHHHMAVEQTEPTELEESETETQIHEKLEEDVDYLLPDDETVETDEIIEETGGVEEGEMEYYAETECEDSDDEEKLIAEFLTYQTSCPSPGRYVCNLCHKEFNQPKWLHLHMSSHTNWIKANCKKQPECEICHKSFRGPGMLRMHMKTHEVNKIPTCSICNKEFKSKSILYRHRQTHFEKNFECSMCEKKFSSKYQLNIHEQRHKKQKSHKCPHCDKSFFNETELKNHIQHHLGTKMKQNNKIAISRS